MVSVGSIIGGGFRLFREQPVALAIWSAIYVAVNIALSLLVLNGVRSVSVGGSPMEFASAMILFYVGLLILALVLTAAAFRAVVRPEARTAAFLRLGMDELRLVGLGILWIIGNLLLYFVLAMVAIAISATLINALGNPGPMIFLLLLVILLPIYGLMIFFQVRLSPAIPLTILRRRLAIGEAWTITKGHFWKLFAAYLVIFLIILAVYLLFFAIVSWGYLSILFQGGISPQSMQAASQYQMQQQLGGISIVMLISWIGGGVLGIFAYALWAGSVGTATLELVGPDSADYASTFA